MQTRRECWVFEEDPPQPSGSPGWARLRCARRRPGRVLGPGKLRASLISSLLAASARRFTPLIGRPPDLRGAMGRQVMAWTLW